MNDASQELLDVLSELLEDYDNLLAAYNEDRASDGWSEADEDESATKARAILDKARLATR